MKNIFKAISIFIDKMNSFAMISALFASFIMLFTVLIGIVSRYLMKTPFPWPEELARYSMIIMGFFGMILVLEKRENVKIDFLFLKFPRIIRSIFEIIYDIFIFVFIFVLAYQGYIFAFEAKGQSTEILGFSKMYILIFLPFCASIMLIQVIKRILSDFLFLIERKSK